MNGFEVQIIFTRLSESMWTEQDQRYSYIKSTW